MNNPFAKSTPEACKRYLDEIQVSYVDLNPLELRVLCGQKKRRVDKDSGKQMPVTVSPAAKSLDALKSELKTMTESNFGPKAFSVIKAYLACVEGPVVLDRCTGPKDVGGCKGIIFGNKCKKCERATTGVKSFFMKLQLADLDDRSICMEMAAWGAIAKKIFGTEDAGEVSKRAAAAIEDTLETWAYVPVQLKVLTEYDLTTGFVRVVPFDIVKLSLDYATDYDANA